jgi:hypothetical protein
MPTPLTTDDLRDLIRGLAMLEEHVTDAEMIDQIRLLEEVKSAAAAAQARVTVRFVSAQRAAQVTAGAQAKEVGKGIAAQVALAKRESPARARRYVGWAGVLVGELPETLNALADGRITEWRAQIVARETAWLSVEHRRIVDATLSAHIESYGDRRVEAEAKKLAYRLDPHGFMARIKGVEAGRRVSLRPAPDTMSILTGFLPVAQGVAVVAALRRHADSRRGAGDERSRAQIMADTLVERVTGQQTATGTPVEVKLLMTDQSFFNAGPGAGEPAVLEGYGPVPAELGRRLVAAADQAARVWLRRLYADPGSGRLVGMESRRREFGDGLGELLVTRDQFCRTPWCDAPIRHRDHVVPVEDGGKTAESNGQALCEACNYAKQAAGWRAGALGSGSGEGVKIETPTRHAYSSQPPELPRTPGRPVWKSFFVEVSPGVHMRRRPPVTAVA